MNIGIGGVVTLLNEGGIPAPAFTWDGDSTIEGPGLIDTDQFDVALGGGTLTLNGADLVATGFTVPEGTELVLRNDALLDVVGTTRIEGGTLRLTRGELVTTGALEIDGTGGGFASVILEEGDLTVPNGGYLESGEIVTGSETSVAFTGGLFEFRDDSTLSGDAFVDLDTAFAVPDAGTGFTLATSGRVGDVAIGGAGLLNLTGDLTVDGASSFAGTVDVDGGTLRVANESTGPAAFTVGTLSIRNGGILTFDGSEGSTLTVTANPLLVDAATIDVTSTGNTIDVTDVGLALGNGSNLDVFGSVAMLGGASDLVFTDSSAVLSDGALTLQSTGTFDSAGSTWGITNSSLEVQTADTRLNASTFTVDNDLGALLDFASPDVDWQTDTQFNLAPGTTLTANAITVSGNGVQALNGGFLRLDTLVVESETDFTTSSTVVADTNIQSSGGNMTFLGLARDARTDPVRWRRGHRGHGYGRSAHRLLRHSGRRRGACRRGPGAARQRGVQSRRQRRLPGRGDRQRRPVHRYRQHELRAHRFLARNRAAGPRPGHHGRRGLRHRPDDHRRQPRRQRPDRGERCVHHERGRDHRRRRDHLRRRLGHPRRGHPGGRHGSRGRLREHPRRHRRRDARRGTPASRGRHAAAFR